MFVVALLPVLPPFRGAEETDVAFWVFGAALLLVFVATFASVVALYFDRKYVAVVSEWNPSKWYYLMAIPTLITDILAVVYLYNRHKRIGPP